MLGQKFVCPIVQAYYIVNWRIFLVVLSGLDTGKIENILDHNWDHLHENNSNFVAKEAPISVDDRFNLTNSFFDFFYFSPDNFNFLKDWGSWLK